MDHDPEQTSTLEKPPNKRKRNSRKKHRSHSQEKTKYLPEANDGIVMGIPQQEDEDSKHLYRNEYGGRLPIGSMRHR
jgi:hypothetical protein